MKIIRLQAENLKKLTAVEIVPDGSVVQITGRNGSGKSSVLDAIYWALAGTRGIDSQPIRRGADSATIRLDLGEVIVTRKFTGSGNTSLVVEAASGARFPSPQRMLDELLGALTFDPLEFARMEPRKQLDALRGLVKLDIDIDELDAENTKDYEVRKEVNRRLSELAAEINSYDLDASMPCDPVDESALLAEMEDAARHNAAIERRRARCGTLSNEEIALREKAAGCRRRAEDLLTEAELLDRRADEKVKEALTIEVGEPIDTAEVRRKIEEARRINEQIKVRQKHDAALARAVEVDAESKSLTATMEGRKRLRENAIASAAMPVPGLSFGDGEVLYNEIPFSQASSAEQLRVSVAIAMAANPKLRVLRIKDGSLLDDDSLALIADMARSEDYQVWMERVDTSGRVGVVMEEGEVVAVNGTAVEAAAEQIA